MSYKGCGRPYGRCRKNLGGVSDLCLNRMKNNTIIVTDVQGKEVVRGTVPATDGANIGLQVAEFMRDRVYEWIPAKAFPNSEIEYVGEIRSEDGRQLAVVKSRHRSSVLEFHYPK